MNNEKKKGLATVVTITVFACLLFCTPVSASYNWFGFPMQGEEHPRYHNGTVANGTVIGGVYVDAGHGLTGDGPITSGAYTQTFNVPAYDEVRFAHLYVHVWGATENYHGWVNTSLNGHSLENITLLGDDDVGSECDEQVWCTSHGVNIVWYDVIDLVTSGAISATALTGKISSGFDGRVGMIELIVVYEKEGMDETRYWVVQGHDALAYATSGHPAKDYGYTYFNGTINPDEWATAVFYNTWLTGDMFDTDTLWFNDNQLCVGCTNYEQGAYLDFKAIEVKNATVDYLNSSNNYATYGRDGDSYVHWLNTVLVLSRESKPDLIVEKIEEPFLPYYNYTLAVVANHTYKVNATVKNVGSGTATESNVTLHVDTTLIGTLPVPSLDAGSSKEVQFTWAPTDSGTYTLEVSADALDEVNETDEANNNMSKNIDVLPEVQADLAITPNDIVFLPAFAWHTANNKTTIQVNVTNNGTRDANNFEVTLSVDNGPKNSTVTSVAAKAVRVTSFGYNAAKGGPYAVKVVLDANGAITESTETNNEAVKPFTVIEIRIRDTHHYGDTSTYNGKESDFTDVEMFDVVKLVPGNTTPWAALNSVAYVKNPYMASGTTFVYGIDGLDQDMVEKIYWYLYMNGRYVPSNILCGEYPLSDGETMHWDFQKQIYSATDSFTPPCTVQSYNDLYPEPFTHGYWDTEWNTTIVYPAESPEYMSIANEIRNKLVSRGVPHARIDIDTDSNVTSADKKETNNLILLGNYTGNDIIVEINPYHEYFGMVVFYRNGKMIDDYDNAEYDSGSVVQAFDNPYDDGDLGTNDSWNEPGPVIFMASGLTDNDAKAATELLINRTEELNMFWVLKASSTTGFFDTGCGTYPSISGVHKGNFTPKCDIVVQQIYTYPCTGTGGHSERVIFHNSTGEIINASWEGYQDDYSNISVSPSITLSAGTEYSYEIFTGSYPQIIHEQKLTNECGTINCTEFIDANGRRYDDWIPAIKLF